MSDGPIIELRDVQKIFADHHALRGVTLDIAQGEFFSLLGPSGCGKTTLLRAIAGFEDISSGAIFLAGKVMENVPANKRPTNMVFQSYAIFPHLSVGENVGFGLRRSAMSRSEKNQAVHAALEMVGLEQFATRAAHALSGGQRQRVALARALILKPKVLLLDEPLSALDRKLREQMQAELRALQRQVGITFVLVTHDQEEALIMSDRIAVMFDGQIAQVATPQDLYRHPASRQVAEFIGMMNFLPAVVSAGDGQGPVAETAGLGRCALDQSQFPAGVHTGAAHVGLRPETMTLLMDGEIAPARIAHGQVVEVTYYGDMTYYDILLIGAERPVTVSMRNSADGPGLGRGQNARVSWHQRSLIVFA